MHIAAVTLFPGLFEVYRSEGLFARASEKGLVDLSTVNIRDFTLDKHRTADDIPYGGGPGMVMKPEPVVRAVESLGNKFTQNKVLVVSPRGWVLNQKRAEKLSLLDNLTIVCGRYKGIDNRAIEVLHAEEISIGDYILGAGEIAALTIIDSVVRLLPGFLGDMNSALEDSFSGKNKLLSAPEYTRPREFRNLKVPSVLLNGNHAKIEQWKKQQSLELTVNRRPELIDEKDLSEEEMEFLKKIKE